MTFSSFQLTQYTVHHFLWYWLFSSECGSYSRLSHLPFATFSGLGNVYFLNMAILPLSVYCILYENVNSLFSWVNQRCRFGRSGVECYCQHESGAAVIQLQFLINEVGFLILISLIHPSFIPHSSIYPSICPFFHPYAIHPSIFPSLGMSPGGPSLLCSPFP